MSALLLLTSTTQPSVEVLPSLALLPHQVRILPAEGSALLEAPDVDVVLVDGRKELAHARDLCRLIRMTGSDSPVLLIVTEGGLAVVSADWGMDDVLLDTVAPAELEARLRLAVGRLALQRDSDDPEAHVIRSGDVTVDDATYTAKLGGRPLDLTFKEFELLKYLVQHPGRVFTREQLLQEVWGYDYFGGTRTVDVHVRRLRAKLGPDNETLIGTVRNVGYRFVTPPKEEKAEREPLRRLTCVSDRQPSSHTSAAGPSLGTAHRAAAHASVTSLAPCRSSAAPSARRDQARITTCGPGQGAGTRPDSPQLRPRRPRDAPAGWTARSQPSCPSSCSTRPSTRSAGGRSWTPGDDGLSSAVAGEGPARVLRPCGTCGSAHGRRPSSGLAR